jgi:tRNA pseudouridine38/39 synthase
MLRQKCLPTEVKNKKHQERKRIKLALAESEANSENNSGTNSEASSPAPSSVEAFSGKAIEPSSLRTSEAAPAGDEEEGVQAQEQGSVAGEGVDSDNIALNG